jgi:hypothetical protein
VGIALVVLIPFLRKLITDKAEISPAETSVAIVPGEMRAEGESF